MRAQEGEIRTAVQTLWELVVGERGDRRRRVRAEREDGEGSPLIMRGDGGCGGRIWGQVLER